MRVTTPTTNYELRTTNHGLRTTNHGLRTTNHGLRTANHGSRITDHGPRTMDYGSRTTDRDATIQPAYPRHLITVTHLCASDVSVFSTPPSSCTHYFFVSFLPLSVRV